VNRGGTAVHSVRRSERASGEPDYARLFPPGDVGEAWGRHCGALRCGIPLWEYSRTASTPVLSGAESIGPRPVMVYRPGTTGPYTITLATDPLSRTDDLAPERWLVPCTDADLHPAVRGFHRGAPVADTGGASDDQNYPRMLEGLCAALQRRPLVILDVRFRTVTPGHIARKRRRTAARVDLLWRRSRCG